MTTYQAISDNFAVSGVSGYGTSGPFVNPPLTGTSASTTSFTFQTLTNCLLHQVSNVWEDDDGVLSGNCDSCGQQVIVSRVAGGLNGLLLKKLLVAAACGDFTDEELAQFIMLRQDLKAEQEALDLAFERLTVIEQIIQESLDESA